MMIETVAQRNQRYDQNIKDILHAKLRAAEAEVAAIKRELKAMSKVPREHRIP